jgi:hypothetical protein
MGCQLGKIHRHVKLQPEHIPVPRRRFSHLHIDLVGPLPKSAGYTHLFTAPCRHLRRTVPGVGAFPPLLQAADRRQSRHCVYSQAKTLYITSRRRGGAAAKTWAACRRCRCATTRGHLTADTEGSAAAGQAPPPRHLQMSRRHSSVFAYTASLSFRPTCLLRRAATAGYGQPRLSPRSAAWGGAVARRHLLTALSSADPFILFIFSHATYRQLFT